jgi:uncharacterized RDD family membrane protein YckC
VGPPRPAGSALLAAPDAVTGVMLAGWRSRALAYVIDFFVVMIPLTAICVATGVLLSRTVHRADGSQVTGDSAWGALMIILEVLILSIGYFAICNGVFGCTVGMRPFRIAVRASNGNSRIGVVRAGLRFGVLWLFFLVPFPFSGLVITADLLSPLWDRRRQAWHDRMTATLVVQLPRREPAQDVAVRSGLLSAG